MAVTKAKAPVASTKATATPKPNTSGKGGSVSWDDLLDNLKSGSGNFIYPKDGKTRLRMLPTEPLYTEAISIYQGNPRTKYLLAAYDPEAENPTIKVVVLTKAAFRSLVAMITEGYEFFDLDDGFGITIVRSGSGGDTSWMILPSRKAISVDEDIRESLEDFDLVAQAKEYEESQKRRAAEGKRKKGSSEDGDDEEGAPEEEDEAPRSRRRSR